MICGSAPVEQKAKSFSHPLLKEVKVIIFTSESMQSPQKHAHLFITRQLMETDKYIFASL
jgi:hypothetical protein